MLHFDNGKVCEESARYRIRKIAVYGDSRVFYLFAAPHSPRTSALPVAVVGIPDLQFQNNQTRRRSSSALHR